MDDLEHLLRSSQLVHTTLPALPRETTPKQVSPPVKRLCERLVPAREPCYVGVQAAPSAKINECYKNVQVLVQQKGGRNQTGWLIWGMKGVLLNAERHACWVSPSGELIDVTPKPDGETQILFLPDSQPWNGEKVCPVVESLSDDPAVRDYITIFLAEKEQSVKGITDFGLKQEGFQALVKLNESLAAGKKGRRKHRRRKRK